MSDGISAKHNQVLRVNMLYDIDPIDSDFNQLFLSEFTFIAFFHTLPDYTEAVV